MDKVRILLVDDRKENLFSLRTLLESPQLEIFEAQSGMEALSLMVDHEFALAILDVQMPEMDGFELAELMRGTERTRTIPIIFVTAASPGSGFAFKGYESGAVDFLYKPIDTVMLKSKVQVFVQVAIQKKQLLLAKQAADRANELKSAFLANMSHELRTPLGALLGFAELLEDEELSAADRAKYIETIKRNGKSLIHLIDDILDLSKIEAGYLAIEKEQINLRQILEEVINLLKVSADQKKLLLKLFIADDVPNKILTDSKRLRQILTNIVGNALKFTEKGKIEITVTSETLGENSSKIFVRVKDTGIGINPVSARKLFKPFIQADSSSIRKFGGTGLGLALSQKLAKLMGGDIILEESLENEGSTFLISFMANHVQQQVAQKTNAETANGKTNLPENILQGLKILVVEDSADNQMFIDIILSRRGAILEFANNGIEGMEKALSWHPDVVILDIQMPVQDGYVTIRKLRESNFTTPVMALTAHAMADEKAKCIGLGFDDFLSKPIDQQQLVRKIHLLAQEKTSEKQTFA